MKADEIITLRRINTAINWSIGSLLVFGIYVLINMLAMGIHGVYTGRFLIGIFLGLVTIYCLAQAKEDLNKF